MPSSACDWSSDVCSSDRSEEHTSELQSRSDLVCRLLLEKKKNNCSSPERKQPTHTGLYAVQSNSLNTRIMRTLDNVKTSRDSDRRSCVATLEECRSVNQC